MSLDRVRSMETISRDNIIIICSQGRPSPPPETMMHFTPVSDFPPIFEKFSDSEENFHNFAFSRQIS